MTHEDWLIHIKQTYDEFDCGMTVVHWKLIREELAFKTYLLRDNRWFLMELIVRA